MREKENQQGSPCNVQLNLKVMGYIFKRITPYGGKKNLLHFKSFFEWHQKRHKYDASNVQVNVELDGELHEVEQVYYDKDDMSIHIVASHDTIPEPRYTPLWHIEQGVRIMNEPKRKKEENGGAAG